MGAEQILNWSLDVLPLAEHGSTFIAIASYALYTQKESECGQFFNNNNSNSRVDHSIELLKF